MFRTSLLGSLSTLALTTAALAEVPRVSADIPPVHSLVAIVMGDLGQPDLLVQPGASPHGYAMRPSEARALNSADLVFWVGEGLEPWLEAPLEALASKARAVALAEVEGTRELPLRESAAFEPHDHDHGHADHAEGHDDHDHADHAEGHDDHDHAEHAEGHDDHGHADHAEGHDDHDHAEHAEGHDDHDHADNAEGHEDHDHAEHAEGHDGHDHADHAEGHDDHDHAEHAEGHDGHDHADHADGHEGHDHAEHAHDHGGQDPHVWLDPANALVWLDVIAAELAALDAENAETYRANAEAGKAEIEAAMADVSAELEPVRGRPFVVLHDAYQYFESHFDFAAAGSIRLADGSDPSPSRIREIRARVEEQEIACAFSEPQFNAALIDTVFRGTDATTGVLDPIGVDLEPGPDLYPQLIRGLGSSLADCLE